MGTEQHISLPVSLVEGLLDDFGNRRAKAVRDARARLDSLTSEPDRRAPDGGLYAPPPPGGWPAVTPLSQPTPSAEQAYADLHIHRLERDTAPYVPPRIADMAPGTEFLCEGNGVPGVEHHMRVTEDVYRDGARILWCLTHQFGATAPYVDPSTIRDVTPPKGA